MSIADDLINLAHSSDWRDELLDCASSYSQRVKQDYQEFFQKP